MKCILNKHKRYFDNFARLTISISLLIVSLSVLCEDKTQTGTYVDSWTKNKPAQIAIILDDIGAKASDAEAFSLPKAVTFSILPHTEFSTTFSYFASEQNREVMLHMPMESLHKDNLGPGPILASMYPTEVKNALLSALQTVPHAVGVNNHMGSKLTQMTLQMSSVMQVLASNNLFFIDSRTTRFTKANVIAHRLGVKAASRHVFLDHVKHDEFLTKQFSQLIKRARRNGKAIGIGHPYPITLAFLKTKLSSLPSDIELITVSEYLQEKDKFRVNPMLAGAPTPFVKPSFALENKTPQIAPQ